MYRVGYNDDQSFRRLFKKYTGLSPKHYRNKFKRRFPSILDAGTLGGRKR